MLTSTDWPDLRGRQYSFFFVYNCSRHIVCFNIHKGLLISKKDTARYLERTQSIPVLVALQGTLARYQPRSASYSRNGLLIALESIPPAKPALAGKRIDFAKCIDVTMLPTEYSRGGGEINIRGDMNMYLSAGSAESIRRRSDYDAIKVEFSSIRANEYERFYIYPVNISHVPKEVNKACQKYFKYSSSIEEKEISLTPRPLSCLGDIFINRWIYFASSRDLAKRYTNVTFERSQRGYGHDSLLEIGPRLDYLGRDRHIAKGDPISSSSYANYFRRSNCKAELGPCIVATARNEALYLADWCAYHLALGFEHIYIYTNDNDDSTIETAQRIAHITSRVTVINNDVKDPHSRPQYKAYRHAFTFLGATLQHSWCAVIDIDEYIVIKPNGKGLPNIKSFIRSIKKEAFIDPDVIVLNWVFAGCDKSTISAERPASLPERINTTLGANAHIKSLFKPQKFLTSHCHYPIENPLQIHSVVDSYGAMYTSYFSSIEPGISPKPRIKHGAIMHYYYKSFPEFVWKSLRNTGDQPLASIDIPPISRLELYQEAYLSDLSQKHKAANWLAMSHHVLSSSEIFTIIMGDQKILGLMNEAWALM